MLPIITLSDLQKIITQVGIKPFFINLIEAIEIAFSNWHDFQKTARLAMPSQNGVIELMPISDNIDYAFKYVNGHPSNPLQNKLNVVALGLLADVKTGYPLLFSEMTALTAFRTAATSALAAKYLALPNTQHVGIIGTGAQAEFQILALHALYDLKTVRYYDTDPAAMKKFSNNLKNYAFECIPCHDAKSVLDTITILTTATATKAKVSVIKNDWLPPGLHINGIGGDCPGKTELDPAILKQAKTVVEYTPQSSIEGEIQQGGHIYAELWELVTHQKKGRENAAEITLFDSVGFALEDFATLKYIYGLSKALNISTTLDMIPTLDNPKDLFHLFKPC